MFKGYSGGSIQWAVTNGTYLSPNYSDYGVIERVAQYGSEALASPCSASCGAKAPLSTGCLMLYFQKGFK